MMNLCMSAGVSKTPMLDRFCKCYKIFVYASIDGSDESMHVYRVA